MEKDGESENNSLYSAPNLVRKMDGYFLVVNTDIPNMMVVDDIGKAALEMCRGGARRQDVVRKVSGEFDCAEQDVEHFIDSLLLAKFVGVSGPPTVPVRKSEKKLTGLQLHLTQACNLRCRHCYFCSGTALEDELTDNEYLEFVKSFGDIGLTGITMSGGEPFLRRDLLFDIVEEAHRQGVNHVSLSTNGTLLTEEDADLLRKSNVKVGVSLDGATAETHDHIRGRGVFHKAMEAIRMLKAAGVPTTIGWTLMRANIGEVEKVLHLAKEVGVSGVYVEAVRIAGRAKENIDDTYVPDKDLAACLMQFWKISRKLGIRTGTEAMFDTSLGIQSSRDVCGAGKVTLGIAPNGDVYPCPAFMCTGTFKAGNIREKQVLDIWRESPVLEPFRRISIEKVEGCRDCELKYICGGGCLEDNYEAHGVLDKVSPVCPLLRETFEEILSEYAKEMWTKQQ